MIKKYSKTANYSYTIGFFPTFELLKYQKEQFKQLYVSNNAIDSDGYLKLKNMLSFQQIVVSDKIFSKLDIKENAHVLAVFNKYQTILNTNADHLVLVNPSDQGNLGNAMRTLLAFGYHDLAIIEPAADHFNPKTVRASMGAIFHINIECFTSFADYLAKYPRPYYPFVLSESTPLSKIKFASHCALVFGNEATGLPPAIYNRNNVRIEQSDEVDSLNLTTSIAIGLYELKKQKGLN